MNKDDEIVKGVSNDVAVGNTKEGFQAIGNVYIFWERHPIQNSFKFYHQSSCIVEYY